MDYIKSIIVGIIMECKSGYINTIEMEDLVDEQIESFTDDPCEQGELYSCFNSEAMAKGV